ncbi:MAG: OsmC family protein [Proteobacteria bacterium]|nr:OsmC family protein [Pseudomonadota bacterium]
MPFDKASDKFLEQTGPLAMDAATACAGLDEPPAGFERIWAAFDPLAVMQKRGQIFRPATDEAWQLLCDEGPGLGGTDWAPPPLAWFAAGMAGSVAGAVAEKEAAQGVPAAALSLDMTNHYSLSGSILQGTMQGTGLNPDVAVKIDGLPKQAVSALALEAVSGSLASYLMRSAFTSEFTLVSHGDPVPLDLPACKLAVGVDTLPAAPLAAVGTSCIAKTGLRPDDPDFVQTGGSGLDTVQNRRNRVSATARVTADGAIVGETGIARPKAGVFAYRGSSDAGSPTAPSSAVLLAAGIGFCFMTQLGRYAAAMKRPVHDYRMIQAIDIPLPGAAPKTTPVIGTVLNLNPDAPDPDYARDVMHSARRTCFLHSTLQSSLRCRVTAG